MVEGFWLVQYEGMNGNGGGVAVFVRGKVFGGDTGYSYMGSYESKGRSVRAHVSVCNFIKGIPSVIGVEGDFELEIEGELNGNVIMGTGRLLNSQAVGIALKLTKKAELPN